MNNNTSGHRWEPPSLADSNALHVRPLDAPTIDGSLWQHAVVFRQSLRVQRPSAAEIIPDSAAIHTDRGPGGGDVQLGERRT